MELKKPCCSEEEIESYVWDTTGNRRKGEHPIDKDDHGMDCIRYLVSHVDGREQALSINYRPVGVM